MKEHVDAYGIAAAFLVFLCLSLPFLFPTLAHAEEGGDDDQKPEAVEVIDYSERLEAIEGLVMELPDRETVAQIAEKLDKLTPADDSKSWKDVNTLLSGTTSVELFGLVVQMLQLGVLLALVFVVSFRTFR